MDPYHILNLKSDASIDEIKQRFYKLTQLYHPDKGGNAAKYLTYKEAYQSILKNKKGELKPKTFSSICAERAKPLKNLDLPARKVTPKEFHRKFQEAEVFNDTGYTYNLARFEKENGRVESAFRKEYDTVSKNIEKVIPFTRSSFNSKDFNDTFVSRKKEHFKQNKQVEEIFTEPEPVYLDSHYANNSASLENPQHIYGKDKYSPFNGAYNQHENPMEEPDAKEESNAKDELDAKEYSNDEIRKELAEMRKMIKKQEQIILRLVKKN